MLFAKELNFSFSPGFIKIRSNATEEKAQGLDGQLEAE